MDIINKKRDQKARAKKDLTKDRKGELVQNKNEKVVDFFKPGGDVKKPRKHVGDKRTAKKFVGVKDDSDKVKKHASPYAHKSGKPEDKKTDEKTHS